MANTTANRGKGRAADPQEVARRRWEGANIRRIRIAKRFGQRELSRAVGKESTWLNKAEKGLFAVDEDTMQLIAETLEVSLDELRGQPLPQDEIRRAGALKPRLSTPISQLIRDLGALSEERSDNVVEVTVPAELVEGLNDAQRKSALGELKSKLEDLLRTWVERQQRVTIC